MIKSPIQMNNHFVFLVEGSNITSYLECGSNCCLHGIRLKLQLPYMVITKYGNVYFKIESNQEAKGQIWTSIFLALSIKNKREMHSQMLL